MIMIGFASFAGEFRGVELAAAPVPTIVIGLVSGIKRTASLPTYRPAVKLNRHDIGGPPPSPRKIESSRLFSISFFLRDKSVSSGLTLVMSRTGNKSGFTLIELLVVIGIIAILVALAFPIYGMAIQHAKSTSCFIRMRNVGEAFLSYASDNDGQLPGRVEGPGAIKWPTLLLPYVGNNPKAYVDPGDPVASKMTGTQLTSNSPNNTSFIFNGFNDLGFLTNPNLTVRLVNISDPTDVLLLGEQNPGGDNFYLDVLNNDQNDVLNKTAYYGGSDYVFADGSIQYMKPAQYNDSMWLVNKNFVIPAQ
jgi:prepilin-type N-terminal cleavage/methylation domain-containing protein